MAEPFIRARKDRQRGAWRGLASGLAVTLALSVAHAGAETFDLHLYRYCQPGTFCGHASEQAYQQYICQAVEEMNLVWEPAGISFRPTVMPIDGTSPLDTTGLPPGKNKYYQNPGCKDDDSYDALRTHWRENVAEPDSAALAMMLNAPWNRCCSGIPRTFKNLEKAHGIYCDANPSRGAVRNGQLWAHEMGHHWSLPHTHAGYYDTADGEDPTYDADAPLAKACTDWDANGDAQGCNDDQKCVDLGLGTCSQTDGLPAVSDTPADRSTFEACTLRCQNDPAATKAMCTTDADCDPGEGPCACPGADEDSDGNILDGHTWFASKSSVKNVTGISNGISQGSPHPTWCDTEIKDQTGGTTVGSNTNPSIEVTMRDVMSYHGGDCLGPYVRFGNRREAFTVDQLARIAACRQQIYPRDAAHLPDVCANRGGDDDHDGLCDMDDNCPLARNTCQTDLDGDGDGDACDLCPEDPTPTGDIDGDGLGDACDKDMDGDGCLNEADDHPEQGQLPVMTTLYVGCPNDKETSYVSDAADTDADGVLNCEDPDDDGDGLCDAPGPGCEVVGDACPEVPGSFCVLPAGGDPCPPIWFFCGQQCVEYLLKMTAVINPDPTRDLVFDHISMVNRAIFAEPLVGKTAAESVLAIAEKAMGGPGARAARSVAGPARERVRLELWQRLREGDRLVAVVGEYDSDHLHLGELVSGGLLRLRPTRDAAGAPLLEAETTHGIGITAREVRDRDGDSVPDLGDNCVAVANAAQTDVDVDGFGNACDADLDQDGVVDEGDVAAVEACEGADLAVKVPLLEPETFDGEALGEPGLEPSRLQTALASFCAVGDLDGNGRVDPADSRLAAGLLGGAPGPSALDRGVRPPPPVAPPACVDPVRIQSAIVRLAGLKGDPGSQRLRLEGTLALPQPFVPPDPVLQGVSVTVRDAAGEKLLDVHIPGGAFDGGTGVGWKPLLFATGFRYVNPDGLMGITAVVVRWNAAGQVTVQVSGSGANLAPSGQPLPLLWQLNLDPDRTVTDRCGETDYDAASCTFRRRGAVLACR